MDNTKLIIISIIGIFFICSMLYFMAKGKKSVMIEEDYTSIHDILYGFKNHVVDLTKEDYENVVDEEDYKRSKKLKSKLIEDLNQATYGKEKPKAHVKSIIREFIIKNVPVERVEQLLGVDKESEPALNVMFEILMYRYKKLFDKDALKKWIIQNKFNEPRAATGKCKNGDKAYYVTKTDLENSYYTEKIKLLDDEKYDVLAVLLYQQYCGFGLVDTILEMNINGINIGCSGSIMDSIVKRNSTEVVSDATNSLWIHLSSSFIHFQFLDFGSEDEIRRVIQLLIRYNSPGPLTAKLGFMVNTMYDQSRILALRPPASEYWSTFIRKCSLDNITTESLVIKEGVKNGEICVKLIEYIMRGLITTAVTGRQGAGKTTLMKAIVAYYNLNYNIGVIEMAPELYLRELYPERSIISVQQTPTTTAKDLQDALKKTDRAITIVGEVATDDVAARMIQLGMTGSLCTLFTHHANTAKDLVITLRNSLVADCGFDNMSIAEKQVTDVVKINIHLNMDSGKRYVSRITEIIQLEEGIPYPEYDVNNREDSFAMIQAEYYKRQTDRISFETRDLLTYDKETDTYVIGECMSDSMVDKITSMIESKEEKNEFNQFINYYWKNIKEDGYTGVIGCYDESLKQQMEHPIDEADDFSQAVKFLKAQNHLLVKDYGFGELINQSEKEV